MNDDTGICPGGAPPLDATPCHPPPPSLELLLARLTATVGAGTLLSRLAGLELGQPIFLLRIDAKKSHYDPVVPLSRIECGECGTHASSGGSPRPDHASGASPEAITNDPGREPHGIVEEFIDITGDACPMTFVRVKLRMESLVAGALLRVRLKGDEALVNVPGSLRLGGHEVIRIENRGLFHELVVRKIVSTKGIGT
ncbi:MAG: sulfurtransferase TusA family protein [Magnetococcales bacterium]|nr:sulfurtransferase TusA family protein [Magnetococcales bacterium]